MQTIQTKWLSPTNTKGPRIMARCNAGSLTSTIGVDINPRLNQEGQHRDGAMALAAKLGWDNDDYGTLATGALPDGSYCHVFVKG